MKWEPPEKSGCSEINMAGCRSDVFGGSVFAPDSLKLVKPPF